MFDLDRAVLTWRRSFAGERTFSTDDLDELEDHLRAAYELELELSPGLAPARAFSQACETLGRAETLSVEFAKVAGRGWRRLLWAGRLAYGVSFLLPVARYGITLTAPNGSLTMNLHEGGLPGIQAFLLALAGGPVAAASALTNAVMLLTFWRMGNAGRGRLSLLAVLLGACAVLNLSWLVLARPASDLFAGYYAWLGSFAVTGAALAVRARALPAEAAREHALAP